MANPVWLFLPFFGKNFFSPYAGTTHFARPVADAAERYPTRFSFPGACAAATHFFFKVFT